ncbi:hypothetical protein AURDEDRAFT_113638 [Auricularia subglabra TFB-10046 SS5]|nr:hypothetical protein AURDEDRAFT_113638 [Auricularia subglabra TFB-10046 SS5]
MLALGCLSAEPGAQRQILAPVLPSDAAIVPEEALSTTTDASFYAYSSSLWLLFLLADSAIDDSMITSVPAPHEQRLLVTHNLITGCMLLMPCLDAGTRCSIT